METPLKFEDLSEGKKVENWWFESGTVKECTDPHNVLIEFDNGGSGLYCMDQDCNDRDFTPIYKKSI
jgi:hypothetical protein